jgi:hypothetical protein
VNILWAKCWPFSWEAAVSTRAQALCLDADGLLVKRDYSANDDLVPWAEHSVRDPPANQ